MKIRTVSILVGLCLLFFLHNNVSAEEEVKILVKYKNPDTFITQSIGKPDLKKLEVKKSEAQKRLQELNNSSLVEYAELDQPVYTMGNVSNDPYFSYQESYFNQINVMNAWGVFSPKQNVTVAVLDTGVDHTHEDLEVLSGKNILNPETIPDDTDGHGTHVAGIVGAKTNNEVGGAAISQQVNILPVKVLEGEKGDMSDVIEGIYYAVDQDVDIINLSLGMYNNSQALNEAIQYATSKDILVVAAAGNDNVDRTVYPAAYPEVLAVSSVKTGTEEKAHFANYGSGVDVVTPGTEIFSTFPGGYGYMEGTSMSTPMVSSLAAMLIRHQPTLHNDQLRDIIKSTAKPISPELGRGLIQTDQALAYLKEKNRIYGANATETSIQISKSHWTELENKVIEIEGDKHSGKFIILATRNDFPDSLAASQLSTKLEAPVLLIRNENQVGKIVDEAKRLSANQVLILGGSGAVSDSIKNKIENSGLKTVRLKGVNRYETAVKIAETSTSASKKAFIVSGQQFPDALSIAPIAGKLGIPVLYVNSNKIPDATQQYLKKHKIQETIIVGGYSVISNDVAKKLPSPIRLRGKDRYETNYEVLKYFKQFNSEIYIASANDFPDALAGSALASTKGTSLLLTNSPTISTTTKSSINFMKGYNVSDYRILGGSAAISIPTAWEIDSKFISK
ncbi:cell wall-binding repeat-containing protein [Pseudalkalibacillus sp. Hm43]|uniref:cell wall-binding repeat-containing protein n=1 Tax=Pseudalkalibacillus sp. Hm43 TaxID=3450742 RepID=UPI003F41EC72